MGSLQPKPGFWFRPRPKPVFWFRHDETHSEKNYQIFRLVTETAKFQIRIGSQPKLLEFLNVTKFSYFKNSEE